MANTEERILSLLAVALERYGTKTALAKETGVSQPTLTNWTKGIKSPSLKEISKVLDILKVQILLPEELPDYAAIPKYSAKAGAGSSLVTEAEVEGYYAFRRQFLLRMGISEKNAALFDVIGDSMSPMLQSGDTILVDQGRRDPQDGQIFLVGLGDELLVKRLHRNARGWSLISVNQNFPPVDLEQSDLENFRVYGRVMWFAHVFPA